MDAGSLDRRITLLGRIVAQDPDYGTSTNSWLPVATVWAQVQDYIPSRADRVVEGAIDIAMRPARIRIRFREGISTDMRVQFGTRLMEIVAGPAELGRRDGIEFVAQDISTLGEAP